eukprot:gene2520-2760_t
MPNQVKQTKNIIFDENFKTFRLLSGDSLYTMCITPELSLEHLYWGKRLPESYDLRYLSESCRMSHFNTVEAAPLSFDGKIVMEAETLEEVQKTWKANTNWKTSSSDEEKYQKRRLENYSWRVLSRMTQATQPSPPRTGEKAKRRKSISVTFEEGKSSDELEASNSSKELLAGRRRSISLPLQPAGLTATTLCEDSNVDLMDLNAIAKLIQPSATPMSSPHNKLMDPIKGKAQLRHQTNRQTFERQLGKIGKGTLCVEYTDYGTGDFRTPSFMVVDNYNGSAISPLRYRSHKIYEGKLPMPEPMPAIRCQNDSEASTLVVTMGDQHSKLEVDLIYVVMHDYDVITRRAVFRNMHDSTKDGRSNNKERSKVIQKASSATLDFELSATAFYMTQMSGSWARENYLVETQLNQGMHSFGSTRGVSSHQHNPFAVITEGPPSETTGETKGFSLVYSGNFLYEAEINEMGRLRLNMGIHPMGLQWYLKEGGVFHTPEAVLVRSSEGLGGMSRMLHKIVLDRLIPKHWSHENPPILLNTWEGKYFHVNHENVIEMARQACKLGMDMIVLDDGWFGQRNNDRSSLGDWIVNLEKFPLGLKGLVEEINAMGLKFGLWFEPEMVSEQSVLYAAHPDWAFQIPGRPRQLGRNQMVLDISRQDVRDHLFQALSAVLLSANIEYIKWDMNRPLTEVYSIVAGSGDVWQAEISHRFVLGTYDLQNRIAKAFPHILFENCASGGGRFDLGMLYFSPQIWCSDNTDALVRMRIQYGTSLAYPARCIGAHVSIVPNHVTGNTTRLRTRGFVAMCGTFGYELDISAVTPADRLIFQKQCEFYRQIAPIVRWGEIYRLWDPFKMRLAAWMYITRDKSKAVVFAFSANSDHWSNLVPRLQLQGLQPDSEYEVVERHPSSLTQSSGTLMIIESEVPAYQLGVSVAYLTGDILMNAGLPIKFYTLDDSAVFVLTQRPAQLTTPSSSLLSSASFSPAVTGISKRRSTVVDNFYHSLNIYGEKELDENRDFGMVPCPTRAQTLSP